MYHRVRRKMRYLVLSAIVLLSPVLALPKFAENTDTPLSVRSIDDNFENNIIDFDEEYSIKFNKIYGNTPWHSRDHFNKESHKYTVVKDDLDDISMKTLNINKTHKDVNAHNENVTEHDKIFNLNNDKYNETRTKISDSRETTTETVIESTVTPDYSVIPLELISTTENILISILESTTEADLTVIPLSTTQKVLPKLIINQTVTLPPSTQTPESTTYIIDITTKNDATTEASETTTEANETMITESTTAETVTDSEVTTFNLLEIASGTDTNKNENVTVKLNATKVKQNESSIDDDLKTNSSKQIETINRADFESTETSDRDLPLFSELDVEDHSDIPEDYYDTKDVVPTKAPSTDALSVIFGFAGSVVESVVETVAERVVPKGIFDLFKRMQRQNEALEAERLRSREENGGLGQFGRNILKSISTGISKPLSQLMTGARDIGSLDSDRGFVSSLASGVTSVANVANSLVDSFKDRVQAIYPGTVWCGDGHSATARSSDLGLFFFTDTCCRQHDACKLYIKAGETKYGLTNTGLFTRSHCSCDTKFRECLRRTNSLVSAQIGLTYFNVLGPQCFRRAHPIVRCLRKTRITGQKCEEYELDYTKPKMWQWFDNETF